MAITVTNQKSCFLFVAVCLQPGHESHESHGSHGQKPNHYRQTVITWLVVTGTMEFWMTMTFQKQLGMECHHPNWRTPSFFRWVGKTTNQSHIFLAVGLSWTLVFVTEAFSTVQILFCDVLWVMPVLVTLSWIDIIGSGCSPNPHLLGWLLLMFLPKNTSFFGSSYPEHVLIWLYGEHCFQK